MNDTDLDALLAAPLPELDAAEFSVQVMERIARHQARPARILSWLCVGVLFVVVAAACVFGALIAPRTPMSGALWIPSILMLLMLIFSYVVLRSARE